MKLLLYNCETTELQLDDKVTVLEIENPKVFNGILTDFINGSFPYKEVGVESSKGLLSSKDIFCVIDLFNFNINDKSFINKIYKYIDKYITENTLLRLKYDEAFSDFATVLSRLLNDIDIDFDFQLNNEVKNSLSLINLSINIEDNDLLDKLLQLIKITSELSLYEIVVLVNVKAYLMENELTELYKQSLYYNIPLILLESRHLEKLLENEQKLFVDDNFCDIIIS